MASQVIDFIAITVDSTDSATIVTPGHVVF